MLCTCGLTSFELIFSPTRSTRIVRRKNKRADFRRKVEAPPGFEPGVEVLQIS